MSKNNNFCKTEQLLYNYKGIIQSIKFKEEYLQFLQKYGLQEKSKNFVGLFLGESKDNSDLLEEKMEEIKQDIYFIQKCVKYIDLALERIKDDYYYQLIELKYFEGKSMEYIAEYYDTATITIYRNRARLIHKIKNYIFAEEFIKTIFKKKEG